MLLLLLLLDKLLLSCCSSRSTSSIKVAAMALNIAKFHKLTYLRFLAASFRCRGLSTPGVAGPAACTAMHRPAFGSEARIIIFSMLIIKL